uniref:Uncharacterized protein n=1 Tax=Arundo donax TaxID=35708 RepID=A0A0A8ZZX1_ARUDO
MISMWVILMSVDSIMVSSNYYQNVLMLKGFNSTDPYACSIVFTNGLLKCSLLELSHI